MSKLPPLALGLLTFAFLSASIVLAQSPRDYYDWSSTLENPSANVLGITALAQGIASSSAKIGSVGDYQRLNNYFLVGNFAPNNPLFFIKQLEENFQLATTNNPLQKDQLILKIAGERLHEMQGLENLNTTAGLSQDASLFKQEMSDEAKALHSLQTQKSQPDVANFLKSAEIELAKEDLISEQIEVKAPGNVKDQVKLAEEGSWQSTDTLADVEGKLAVPPDVSSRIDALKSQGFLTADEATKLVGAKTRVEARQELETFVNEGIMPKADFLRMDETAKAIFPDDFNKLHETERFLELQKLENEKPDPATLNKLQSFAKGYKSGDTVPADLRKYWVPVVRLEELQNTLRPDLVDTSLFKNDTQTTQKFSEVVQQFKPTPADLAKVQTYIQQNKVDVSSLPPEYQRMYNIAKAYGTSTGTSPSTTQTGKTISCPSNAHFVAVGFSPEGGYCIPNFTPTSSTGDFSCPSGFHKSYSGGPCLPDSGGAGGTNYSLPPLTATPGNYPSPFYAPTGRCGNGSHWTSDPFGGGYCSPDNYNPTSYTGVSTGNSGSGGYLVPNASNRDQQEAVCRGGGGTCTWNNDVCNCQGYHAPSSSTSTSGYTPPPGYGSCPSGQYWTGSNCANNPTTSSGSTNTSCPSGQYWNGSSCVNNPTSSSGTSTTDPAVACANTSGCGWTGSTCQCSGTPPPPPPPPPGGTPPPPPPPPPPSTSDPATECANHGGSWDGSTCQCPSSGCH